jgi:L-lactate dehydrogenase
MTYLTAHYAKEFDVPKSRVFGTGTMLDTARFRSLLGTYAGVDPQHVHGYVIGEHGDSEVLTWSLTTIGAMHLEDYCNRQNIPLNDNVRQDIDHKVRNAAYAIIEGKGATYYGIGSALAKLVDVILHDQRSILTVSTPIPQVEGVSDVSVSLPHLVGGDGILATLPLALNTHEAQMLYESANVVKKAITDLV